MAHDLIRHALTMGTFNFFIWIDAEFQCGSDGTIQFARHAFARHVLVIAQFMKSWQ